MIQNNVIHAAYLTGVKKLLFFGSACSYPRDCPQPMKEEYILTGKLEQTNEPYAVAKIAGIIMCRSYNKQYGTQFICALPTNAYGPNDNFDLNDSHVIPALLRKLHKAKIEGATEVVIWGSGTPLREFIHADDVADATLFLMGIETNCDLINVGSGEEVAINTLVSIIKEVIGYKGSIVFDTTRPDGMFRKVLDISIMKSLGWNKKVSLVDGIRDMYAWYLNHEEDIERKWQIKK
jgi:GDP-L-fucose synthase